MEYIKSEVMALVENVLGKDADGIYVSWNEIEYGSCNEIYTSREFNIVIEDTDEYEIRRGVTKVVIIPNDKPYVIKMSITHVYDDENSNYNKILQELNSYDDSIKYERNIYNHASELLKKLLVENIYVGKFNNLDVYIQEKINYTYSDVCGDPFSNADKEKEILEWYDKIKPLHTFGRYFCEKLYNAGFTTEEIILLDDEMTKFGITDLHNGNICVDMNDNMRILDYAGYDEDEHWTVSYGGSEEVDCDDEEEECEIKSVDLVLCD